VRFVGALVVVLVASSCSAAGAAPSVDVSGDPGRPPTLTYVAPLQVSSTYRRTVWEGTGPPLVDGAPVLLDFWVENATDATVVSQTYGSKPETLDLTREALGDDLYQSLHGHRAGARILQVSPAPTTGSDRFPTVTVIDVLGLRADGQRVAPRTDVTLPEVTLAADGTPSIKPTGTDPPTTAVTQPLIRGDGIQVGSQDTVTFQFAMFTWAGELMDSSWSNGIPQSQSLLDLPQALVDGLVDQTVGSQIELVVPPSEGWQVVQSDEYKDQTIVVVVDVLATRTPTADGS